MFNTSPNDVCVSVASAGRTVAVLSCERAVYVVPGHMRTQAGRVRHSVAIYGQCLLFCDQRMREKVWFAASVGRRRRERRTLLAGAAGELAKATRLRQARPSRACVGHKTVRAGQR